MAKKRKPPIGLGGSIGPSAQKAIDRLDAENMVRLLHDLFTYMPYPFRERLRAKGNLLLTYGKYSVQMADSHLYRH
jgi:hypothetical protein